MLNMGSTSPKREYYIIYKDKWIYEWKRRWTIQFLNQGNYIILKNVPVFSFLEYQKYERWYLRCFFDEKQRKDLESSAFDNVETHLARISGLQLHLNAIQFSLEPILRACVHHLHPHSRWIRWPTMHHPTKPKHISTLHSKLLKQNQVWYVGNGNINYKKGRVVITYQVLNTTGWNICFDSQILWS